VTDLKIVIAGCMDKQQGEAILRRVPEVDIIMGYPLCLSSVGFPGIALGPHYATKIEDLLDQTDLGSQVISTDEIEIEVDIAKPRRSSDATA